MSVTFIVTVLGAKQTLLYSCIHFISPQLHIKQTTTKKQFAKVNAVV
jgi:hypothetical protein